jgi:hypothetical protein
MIDKPNSRGELKDRTWQAMLSYAFFRVESALTIALILVLVVLLPQPFAVWRWWYWLVLGAVAEGLIIYTSLTDPATGRHVVEEMLREEYNPGTLRDLRYRERLQKALDYHRRMDELVHETGNELLRERLAAALTSVDDWTANMYRVSTRLDAFASDRVIAQDMKTAPQEVAALEKRLASEPNPTVRAQVEETLKSKRAQAQSLQSLQSMMDKADLQLEQTLSDLGNIYSQLRQIEARDVESGRAQRIADDIGEQVSMLKDIVRSMDEVYSPGAPGRA